MNVTFDITIGIIKTAEDVSLEEKKKSELDFKTFGIIYTKCIKNNPDTFKT